MGHTALEFKAATKKTSSFVKPMEASGVIAFNDEGKPQFTASFAWSEDGRMLPLHGNFVGKTLVLNGSPGGWDKVNFRVRAVDGNVKMWNVFVVNDKKEYPFCELKISK